MCQMASIIITENNEYFHPDRDSHEEIIQLHGLERLDVPHSVDLLRIEVTPEGKDYSKPLSEWKIKTDQEIIPDWYCPEADEKRIRECLARWAKHHVITGDIELIEGNVTRIVLAGNVKELCLASDGEVYFYGSSTCQTNNSSGGSVCFYRSSTCQTNNSSGGSVCFYRSSTCQTDNSSGGLVCFYGSSTCQTNNSSGGLVCFSENSTCQTNNSSGGRVCFYGSSTCQNNNSSGGYVRFWDNSTCQNNNSSGGEVWFYENSTCQTNNSSGGRVDFKHNSTCQNNNSTSDTVHGPESIGGQE